MNEKDEKNKDINKLSKEDWLMLARVLQCKNWCEIDSIEQVRNFEEIQRNRCEEIMQDDYYFIGQYKNGLRNDNLHL